MVQTKWDNLGSSLSGAGFGGLLDGHTGDPTGGDGGGMFGSGSGAGLNHGVGGHDSWDMYHSNHDNGGMAGLNNKGDHAHNFGDPKDSMDHYPVKKPEEKNKDMDDKGDKKKNEEE